MTRLCDLVNAYSKRTDLLVDLRTVADQLTHAGTDDDSSDTQSVRSTGRTARAHGLHDRLNDADFHKIVLSFDSGTPRHKIGEQYGISLSSVGRLLGRYRQTSVKASSRVTVESDTATNLANCV